MREIGCILVRISILRIPPSVLRLSAPSVADVPERVRNNTALWVTGHSFGSLLHGGVWGNSEKATAEKYDAATWRSKRVQSP